MYNYDISFPQIDPHLTVCLWSHSRTQTHPYNTIAPHQSSFYPEYLSPTWDEDTQRAVVWTRLREHRKLANPSLAKINERYKALHQEQQTQVESRHKLSSRDIKSNLTTMSRAQKVFKAGIALNRRGSHNVPKKYLKATAFETVGDETGYYVYHQGSFFPIEFDFDHCFWFIVKFNNQRSCWESYKPPTEDLCLDIPDNEVTDPSTWGPIDDGKDSNEEDTKSEKSPESIDIKVPTEAEEKSEKQLGKLAELIPTLSRTRSNTATSRLPPITTVMTTQTTIKPMQTVPPEEDTSTIQ